MSPLSLALLKDIWCAGSLGHSNQQAKYMELVFSQGLICFALTLNLQFTRAAEGLICLVLAQNSYTLKIKWGIWTSTLLLK